MVKLDVFEDLASGLGLPTEELILWKTRCFQRTEECLHRRIFRAVSCRTHALLGTDNIQGFAHRWAAVLAASIGVKVQACLRLA